MHHAHITANTGDEMKRPSPGACSGLFVSRPGGEIPSGDVMTESEGGGAERREGTAKSSLQLIRCCPVQREEDNSAGQGTRGRDNAAKDRADYGLNWGNIPPKSCRAPREDDGLLMLSAKHRSVTDHQFGSDFFSVPKHVKNNQNK